MAKSNDIQINVRNLLIPVSLVAFTLFLVTGYQTLQIMRDRDMLNTAYAQQEKDFESAKRLEAQLNALVSGVQRLATQGDKNAQAIVEKLKAIGVQPQQPQNPPPPAAMGGPMGGPMGGHPPMGGVTPAPLPPANMAPMPPGPVKP